MGFNTSIKRRIEILANEKLPDILKHGEEQIYTSAQMKKYLSDLSGTLQGSLDKALRVDVYSAAPFPAQTDGDVISLNWKSKVFQRYAVPEARFDAFMGGFFHEMAHVLYSDFAVMRDASAAMKSGKFYGDKPVPKNKEEEEWLADMEKAMSEPKYSGIFWSAWNDISNCIDDRHDEDAIISKYKKLVRPGIYKVRASLFQSSPPFEKLVASCGEYDKKKKLELLVDAILQFSRFGEVFMLDNDLWKKNDILIRVKDCLADIDDAVYEHDCKKRTAYINRILLHIWPFIKDILENVSESNRNGQGQGNNSGAPSDEAIQQVLEALNNASAQFPQSAQPQNRATSETAKAIAKEPSSNGSKDPNAGSMMEEADKSSETAQNTFANIAKDIAVEAAEEQVENELKQDTLAKINTVNMNSTHAGRPVKVVRDLNNTNTQLCDAITQEIRTYTKRLIAEYRKLLEDVQIGGLNKHRLFGRRLIPGDTYRPDGRYYANKKLPQDLPDMAISVLVDNSGSMCGERLSAATRAALMTYDFATALDIPVSVSGHTTGGGGIVYYVYSDFERAGRRDRERIAAMDAHNSNRDGMAIEIAANLLSRRPERYKLLFVISDGQPNDFDYGGQEAIRDIQSILRKYRRQGIEIIGEAIGHDAETIRGIYGDNCLVISDLARLPVTMAKIIKSRILQQIG